MGTGNVKPMEGGIYMEIYMRSTGRLFYHRAAVQSARNRQTQRCVKR